MKLAYLVAPLTAIALAIATVAMASPVGQPSPSALAVNPSDFSTTIDNPLFPLSTLGPKVIEGEETDPDTGEIITTRLTSQVLPGTINVAGVEVLVLEEKAYENDELIEVALDYFAQHTDGTVYYFGEDVDNYINGIIDNHAGTWHAGEAGAEPGIIMPAAPFVGQIFKQENAPGVAEDEAKVVALNETVGTAAGEFTGCLKTEDTNPLETPLVIEIKFHCPGVGFARVDGPNGFEELVSYTIVDPGASPSPSPTGSPSPSPTTSPTPTVEPSPTATGSPTPTASPTPTTEASPTAAADDDDEDRDDEEDDDEDDDEDAGSDDDEDEGSEEDDEDEDEDGEDD